MRTMSAVMGPEAGFATSRGIGPAAGGSSGPPFGEALSQAAGHEAAGEAMREASQQLGVDDDRRSNSWVPVATGTDAKHPMSRARAEPDAETGADAGSWQQVRTSPEGSEVPVATGTEAALAVVLPLAASRLLSIGARSLEQPTAYPEAGAPIAVRSVVTGSKLRSPDLSRLGSGTPPPDGSVAGAVPVRVLDQTTHHGSAHLPRLPIIANGLAADAKAQSGASAASGDLAPAHEPPGPPRSVQVSKTAGDQLSSSAHAVAAEARQVPDAAVGSVASQVLHAIELAAPADAQGEPAEHRQSPIPPGAEAQFTQTLRIALSPGSLGHITVLLIGRGTSLRIRMEAELAETAASLEADRTAIEQRLAGSGHSLSELVIARLSSAVADPAAGLRVTEETLPDPTALAGQGTSDSDTSRQECRHGRRSGTRQQGTPAAAQSPVTTDPPGTGRWFLGKRSLRAV